MAMAKEGVPRAEAAKRIWMVDSKGLIVKVMPSFLKSQLKRSSIKCVFLKPVDSLQGRGNLNHEKEEFAQDHPHIKTLEEVVHTIKPTTIIGEPGPMFYPSATGPSL